VPEKASARPGAVLVVVSAAVFLASLDLFIVNIAFPDIRLAFPGTNLSQVSWVLNGYTVVFAAFLAAAGRLADRYGRKRLFLIGLAIFTVASAACAVAWSLPLLIAFRVLQAIGGALVMPTSLALLLTAYPASRRAVAVGVWSAIGAAAAALGPPIGGLLVAASWRWVFLVNLPVGILALIFGPRVLTETKESGSRLPDLLGAAGLLLGVGALAYALVETPSYGWTGTPVVVAAVAAVVTLVWVVVRSTRHSLPVLDLHSLRVPTIWLACVGMLLFSAGFAGMLFGNVLFLTGVWHESELLAGLSLSPGPLVVVVVSVLGGRLVQRVGAGVTAAFGGLFFALGNVFWLWQMGPTPDYLGAMLPGQLLTGLGVGLTLPSLSGLVGSALPAARWGSGSSMLNTARQIGAVLGTAVIVTLLGGTPDLAAFRHGWTLILVGALGAGLAGCAIALVRSYPKDPVDADVLVAVENG
jgi:EmrB/QacA subfamily drug resistance transporter